MPSPSSPADSDTGGAPTDPDTADSGPARVLVRTRPWLVPAMGLVGVVGMIEAGIAVSTALSLGPPPDESYAAGRWSFALASVPMHAALGVGAAGVVASLAGEWIVVGRLKREGREEDLLAALRHQRGCWRWAATAAGIGVIGACGGFAVGAVVVIRIVQAALEAGP